jgi:hypothetical protein
MLFESVCNINTPRSIKRVIRSDKPITSVFPVKSQKCDFGAERRCRLFATSAGPGKGLNGFDLGHLVGS